MKSEALTTIAYKWNPVSQFFLGLGKVWGCRSLVLGILPGPLQVCKESNGNKKLVILHSSGDAGTPLNLKDYTFPYIPIIMCST